MRSSDGLHGGSTGLALGDARLTIEQLNAFLADGAATAALSAEAEAAAKVGRSHAFFAATVASGADVYGVTTGFGSASKNRFSADRAAALQKNLVRYHGCGLGHHLTPNVSLAVLVLRTHALCLGGSGVSPQLVGALLGFINRRIVPVIPALGSVGASGDLTPLSYVAAAVTGERQVWHRGAPADTAPVLTQLGVAPYELKGREALALMNGTSVMTALAAVAWGRVHQLATVACRLAALLVEVSHSRTSPFMPALHRAKPHAGQMHAAASILSLLHDPAARMTARSTHAIQDVYSIRCSPQVIGVLFDTLTWSKEWIECEMNSVTDNPVFDQESGVVLNGGNFFGGHVANACDALKSATYQVVNLFDRQFALLMGPGIGAMLTDGLIARRQLGDAAALNHGLKALQITTSALAAELQKLCFPAAVLSRPTEADNQDVVSMGTIAARDLEHAARLGEACAAMLAMALNQALFVAADQERAITLTPAARAFADRITAACAPVTLDRPLDADVESVRRALFDDGAGGTH